MTAADLNKQAIADLGEGNIIGPSEALKRQLAAVLERLDRMDRGEQRPDLRPRAQVDNAIDGLHDELSGFVGVAFPIDDHTSLIALRALWAVWPVEVRILSGA